jgi:hypothetical protein
MEQPIQEQLTLVEVVVEVHPMFQVISQAEPAVRES